MQCFQCGSEQPGGNVFCTKCGARLSGARPAPDISFPEPKEELVVSTSAKEEEEKILRELKEALKGVDPDKVNEEQPPAKSSWSGGKKLAVVGAVVALIILVVIGLDLGLRKGVQPAPPPPAPIEIAVQPPPPPVIDDPTRSTIGKIAALLEAIEQYNKTKKTLPSSLVNLNRSYATGDTLKDGWGQNILYLVDLTNKTFVLRSLGPDGKRETADDISVMSEDREAWLKDKETPINEWQVANPNLYAQLTSVGPSAEELKKLEAARKLEEEQKKQEAANAARHQEEEEQKRLETARLEEERRRQAEAKGQEEERQAARAREEVQRQQQAARRAESLQENFINGLSLWDAPATWEIVKEKDTPALRVQGLGFLKPGQQWDNYKVEFEVKINKESAGWVLRAQNSGNFYLFKLGSEKAKAIPKNSLVKYIRADDKYLNSLKREDAPGAAGVIPLSIKVRNKDYYRVMLTVRGNTITHYLDGIQVDAWNDDTFTQGRFGFNASAIEQATIRNLTIEPLR
jgi:hypothetical protein